MGNEQNTGELYTVNLKSEIVYAYWLNNTTSAGEKAKLEVGTQWIAHGADIEIHVMSEGKELVVLRDKIFNNKFKSSFIVPENAKEELIFTAKLPAHNIERKSKPIIIMPPRIIFNAQWSLKEIKNEENVLLTGETSGIAEGEKVYISIFEYDSDDAHELIKRLTPIVVNNKIEVKWTFKYQDDVMDLPTGSEYKQPQFYFKIGYEGAEAESDLLKFIDYIEVILLNSSEKESYLLTFPDGSSINGTFNQEGLLEQKDALPGPYIIAIN